MDKALRCGGVVFNLRENNYNEEVVCVFKRMFKVLILLEKR
jgi:hypothetical protein